MELVNPLLPALRADTPGLLRRAGGLLGAVQGIQQESSADYWFAMGLSYKQTEEWEQALHCFDRVLALDATHWRGWLLKGLACAHLEKNEQCIEAIFGSETRGRPTKEADFYGFYLTPELEYLANFLAERKGNSDHYQASVALALVHFHSHNLEFAEELLSGAKTETVEQAAWKQYFLSRVEFEKCNYEESISALLLPLFGELAENPRVLFWVGRAYIQSRLLATAHQWVFCEGANDYYLPDEAEQPIKIGIVYLEKSVAMSPLCAECYFTLGQAKQLMESPRWGGWGAGLREFHAAVSLDRENKKYIMARYFSIESYSHIVKEEILPLIARVEAAEISLDDLWLQHRTIEDLYTSENYASCLLLFNKTDGFVERGIVITESKREDEAEWLAECVVELGGVPSMRELQALADAERASWKERMKSHEFLG